jgi:hypothetical protein
MALSDIRDIMVMSMVAVGGYFAWQWYNKTAGHTDTAGTQYSTYYVPSPDNAFKDHPFDKTILDPVYDAGWDFMGRLRGETQDYTI